MAKDQHVDQGRWKFWKGSDDAVGQFIEEIVAFFDEGRHVQVRYLPNVTPTFPTTGLVSVVS